MKKWSILLAAWFLIPTVSLAQDEIIKNFSSADFEKVIKEDLKKTFAKKGEDLVVYDIKDTDYYAEFNSKGKFILFVVYAKADSGAVNALNAKAVYSRVYAVDGGRLRFEGTLSFRSGVTRAQVKSYYDLWSAEVKKLLGG